MLYRRMLKRLLWMIPLVMLVTLSFDVWSSFDQIVISTTNQENRMYHFDDNHMKKCNKSVYYHRHTNTRGSFLMSTMSLIVAVRNRMITSDGRSNISNLLRSNLSFTSPLLLFSKSFVFISAMNIPQTTFVQYYSTISRPRLLPYQLSYSRNHWWNNRSKQRQQLFIDTPPSITKSITPSTRIFTAMWMTTTTNDHDDDDDDDAAPTHSPKMAMDISTNSDKVHQHSDSIVRTRTLQWVRQIVIGLNLCPFALQPYQNQQIKVVLVRDNQNGDETNGKVNNENYHDKILERVQNEIDLLVKDTVADNTNNSNKNSKHPTTTLIVCPECYPNDFMSYLNIVHEIEDMIEDNDEYDGVVQLASFHPKYCFDGSSDTNDPDNCTNQSPYPTFHILREVDVSQVVDTVLPNQDSSIVWSRNVDLLRTLRAELSETEFTSVLTIPPPIIDDKESDSPVILNDTKPLVTSSTKRDLIFRVRQILRRFPITLLRSNDK